MLYSYELHLQKRLQDVNKNHLKSVRNVILVENIIIANSTMPKLHDVLTINFEHIVRGNSDQEEAL